MEITRGVAKFKNYVGIYYGYVILNLDFYL